MLAKARWLTLAVWSALVVLLATCAGCAPEGEATADSPGHLPEWEHIGEHLYRQVDADNGVVCYRAYLGDTPMSCVAIQAPQIVVQAPQRKKGR